MAGPEDNKNNKTDYTKTNAGTAIKDKVVSGVVNRLKNLGIGAKTEKEAGKNLREAANKINDYDGKKPYTDTLNALKDVSYPLLLDSTFNKNMDDTVAGMLEKIGGIHDNAKGGYKDWHKHALKEYAPEKLARFFFENLAKRNPDGNLNGLGFNDTLRRSRMADFYNSKPVDNMVHAFSTNGPEGGSGVNIGSAEAYQHRDMQTEEMRQMERARELDKRRNEGRVDLQNKIEGMKTDMFNTFIDRLEKETGKKYDRQYLNEFWSYQQKMLQYIAKDKEYFAKKLGIAVTSELGQIIMKAASESMPVAMMLAEIYNIAQPMPVSATAKEQAYQYFVNEYGVMPANEIMRKMNERM